MADRPEWDELRQAGKELADQTRSELERIANDFATQGVQLQTRMQEYFEGLSGRSRARTDELVEGVRQLVQEQLRSLGVATRDDLRRLEARLDAAASFGTTSQPKKKTAAKKVAERGAAKKTAKKAPAKKAAKRKAS